MAGVPGSALVSAAVSALRRAYPTQLPTDEAALVWATSRRRALQDRIAGDADGLLAVSSGCAATGAARHRTSLTEQAQLALRRLDAGHMVDCADCGDRLDFDRLDAAPGVVACATCRRAGASAPDNRWCR